MSKASLALLAASSLSAAVLVAAVPQAAPPTTKPAATAPPATAKAAPAAADKPATAPAPKTTDGTWPREVPTSVGTVTIYLPQLEGWDGATLQFRAALSMKQKADAAPVYGVVWGTARTSVDKDTRLVSLHDRHFTKLVFRRRRTRKRPGGRCSSGRSSRP